MKHVEKSLNHNTSHCKHLSKHRKIPDDKLPESSWKISRFTSCNRIPLHPMWCHLCLRKKITASQLLLGWVVAMMFNIFHVGGVRFFANQIRYQNISHALENKRLPIFTGISDITCIIVLCWFVLILFWVGTLSFQSRADLATIVAYQICLCTSCIVFGDVTHQTTPFSQRFELNHLHRLRCWRRRWSLR